MGDNKDQQKEVRMPKVFAKLGFKKSRRQYDVASKAVFVLTVELLDSSVLECTLSAESTGRDCMDNVCQRLGLHQPGQCQDDIWQTHLTPYFPRQTCSD